MGARKHIHSIEGANHREWKLQQETETRLLHQKVLLHVLMHPWGNVSDAPFCFWRHFDALFLLMLYRLHHRILRSQAFADRLLLVIDVSMLASLTRPPPRLTRVGLNLHFGLNWVKPELNHILSHDERIQ